MSDLKTHTLSPRSGMDPKQLIILLHGLGSNGQDLLSLAPSFSQVFPNAIFLSPDAPFEYDMDENAKNAFQWFSMKSRDLAELNAGAERANAILENYINAKQEEYGLYDNFTAVIGFSQGAAMALYNAPRRRHKLAGVIGYSGVLLGEQLFDEKAYQTPPIHLYHGEMDMVVAVESFHHAKDKLEKSGFPVTGETSPFLDHSIDEKGIESGIKFLKEYLD